MRIIFILTIYFITHVTITAQIACDMPIGTNFDIVGACGVHKNLKLSSSHFFTRNALYLDDGNDWDSGLATTMSQDSAGYPLEIPFPHPTTNEDQIVAFTVGGYQQNYEIGNYVLLYDGTGTFQFANWTSQTVTSVAAGRIEFTIDAVNENGVHIEILTSILGDHIRNIRIVQTQYETDYLTDPFLPQFASKAQNFVTFRFMDWIYTNFHTISDWEDRTQVYHHTQANDPEGCSWELVIELCNYFSIDPWINVPHLADATYIDSMATLFRDQLDPDLTIYLEYSNECWNWIFEQTHWLESAPPFPNDIGRNYGYYSNQVFTRWDAVFSGQTDRIQTVLAGHDYFVLDALQYTDAQGTTNLVDLVSYPGYVALDEENYDTLSLYAQNATPEMVLEMLNANKAENFYWMQQFKTLVADAYNKPFVMYEGGQHITPEWFGLDTSYNQALYDAQIHPNMYSFYQDMLQYYKDDLGVSLFVNFTLSSAQESSFGSWGLLDNNFMEAPWPPKYQAVLDFIDHCGTVSTPEIEATESCISIHPNPTSDYLYINGELSNYAIDIIDATGVIYQNITTANSSVGINLSMLPAGVYFIRLQHLTNQQLVIEKIIKE